MNIIQVEIDFEYSLDDQPLQSYLVPFDVALNSLENLLLFKGEGKPTKRQTIFFAPNEPDYLRLESWKKGYRQFVYTDGRSKIYKLKNDRDSILDRIEINRFYKGPDTMSYTKLFHDNMDQFRVGVYNTEARAYDGNQWKYSNPNLQLSSYNYDGQNDDMVREIRVIDLKDRKVHERISAHMNIMETDKTIVSSLDFRDKYVSVRLVDTFNKMKINYVKISFGNDYDAKIVFDKRHLISSRGKGEFMFKYR